MRGRHAFRTVKAIDEADRIVPLVPVRQTQRWIGGISATDVTFTPWLPYLTLETNVDDQYVIVGMHGVGRS